MTCEAAVVSKLTTATLTWRSCVRRARRSVQTKREGCANQKRGVESSQKSKTNHITSRCDLVKSRIEIVAQYIFAKVPSLIIIYTYGVICSQTSDGVEHSHLSPFVRACPCLLSMRSAALSYEPAADGATPTIVRTATLHHPATAVWCQESAAVSMQRL